MNRNAATGSIRSPWRRRPWLFRISRHSRRTRFSRRSLRSSSRSSVLNPGSGPLSNVGGHESGGTPETLIYRFGQDCSPTPSMQTPTAISMTRLAERQPCARRDTWVPNRPGIGCSYYPCDYAWSSNARNSVCAGIFAERCPLSPAHGWLMGSNCYTTQISKLAKVIGWAWIIDICRSTTESLR
jgi:hypothetical protein